VVLDNLVLTLQHLAVVVALVELLAELLLRVLLEPAEITAAVVLVIWGVPQGVLVLFASSGRVLPVASHQLALAHLNF
jgi:hypothetical protein